MAMTEEDYATLLEYAFHEEGRAIEMYNEFLNHLPLGKDFDKIRKILNHIIIEETNHLNTMAQLIDDLEG
jgi:rubrerythrin